MRARPRGRRVATDARAVHIAHAGHERRAAAQNVCFGNGFTDGFQRKTERADGRCVRIMTLSFRQTVAEAVHLEITEAPVPERLEDMRQMSLHGWKRRIQAGPVVVGSGRPTCKRKWFTLFIFHKPIRMFAEISPGSQESAWNKFPFA